MPGLGLAGMHSTSNINVSMRVSMPSRKGACFARWAGASAAGFPST